jgi:HSP20 family protein
MMFSLDWRKRRRLVRRGSRKLISRALEEIARRPDLILEIPQIVPKKKSRVRHHAVGSGSLLKRRKTAMALVRYDPLNMGHLQSEINRLISNWGDTDSSSATAGWVPNVDIYEFDNRFQLFVDLPGVNPKSVDITLDNGVLTITGVREIPTTLDDEQKVLHRNERGLGQFHRRFILPDTVDSENVKATDANGVLEITIPKQARAQPRRIEVAA